MDFIYTHLCIHRRLSVDLLSIFFTFIAYFLLLLFHQEEVCAVNEPLYLWRPNQCSGLDTLPVGDFSEGHAEEQGEVVL